MASKGKVSKITNISSDNEHDKLGANSLEYGLNRSKNTLYRQITGANFNQISNSDSSMLETHGLLKPSTIKSGMYTKYSKFGYNDPYNRMPNTKEVLFFTKPDLHIMDGTNNNLQSELENVEFFVNLKDYYPEVIDSLQSSHKGGTIALLHNRVKDTLDLPDINSVDIDIASNMHGNNYEYRGSSEASDDGFSFSLEFEDTRHLDIYMFFKAYDEYERLKRLGRITPDIRYIQNKVLHDQIAIYKFTLLDDMMTIAHYAKLWGCYPTSVPRSVFGNGDFSSAGLSLSIQWKSAFIEDMNPLIIYEFNTLMEKYANSETMSTFNHDSGRIDRTWASGAYIKMEKPTKTSTTYVPRLRWIK
jgi:hypothetical protein